MSMTFGELFDSRKPSTDGTVFTDTRTFRVPTPTGQIEGDFTALDAPGVPSIGDPHPTNPLLRADRKEVTRLYGQVGCEVTVYYSGDGRFRYPNQQPEPQIGDSFWNISVERYDVDIPLFQATSRTLPTYDELGELTGTVEGWEWVRNDIKTFGRREVYSREVTIEAALFTPLRTVISAQYDQIHVLPDGKPYLFIPPNVTQVGQNKFRVAYQWLYEAPTAIPTVPPAPPVSEPIVEANYFVTATEVRPSFYRYQVVPAATDLSIEATGVRITIPSVVVVDSYAGNRNNAANPNGLGWQSLPGNPIGSNGG